MCRKLYSTSLDTRSSSGDGFEVGEVDRLRNINTPTWRFKPKPSMPFDFADPKETTPPSRDHGQAEVLSVCDFCMKLVRERNWNERVAVWNSLPEYFGLDVPNWGMHQHQPTPGTQASGPSDLAPPAQVAST